MVGVTRIGVALKRDGERWLLMAGGALLIALGAIAPGTHSQAISVLILTGGGLFVIGVLLPSFKEAEVGTKGFRIKRGKKAEAAPWLKAKAETMSKVAELVLGDGAAPRKAVEETLADMQDYRDPIPQGEREIATLRTLVSNLARADGEVWIGGRTDTSKPRNGIEALQLIDFEERVTFVLRHQGLPQKDVAKILRQEPQEIEDCRRRVQETIAPYVPKTSRAK